MGVLNFVWLTLLTVGSLAAHLPNEHGRSAEEKDGFHLNPGKKWVLLVAGSYGWNRGYRHQADVCHAYQIIKRNGIPEENIIVMMMDDIAYHPRNPTPGVIINRPNGTNVYDGVIIDYKGADVNSTNFINIITGNKAAMKSIGSGKVIEGGPHDTIFISFADHGNTGVVAFPNDFLFADDLNLALDTMFLNKMYSKMLLYFEACNSGSMFDGFLSEVTKVFAITSAGPREDSWGCYCHEDSGPYKTCLGDYFSVTWMEDLDATLFDHSEKKVTAFNNFQKIRSKVTDADVMAYGDFCAGNEKLSTYIGSPRRPPPPPSNEQRIMEKISMSSRDVEENHLKYQLAHDDQLTEHEKENIRNELRQNNEKRLIIDGVFSDIYSKIVGARPQIKKQIGELYQPKNLKLTLDMFPCYKSIIKRITESCFSLTQNPHTMNGMKIFANLCVVDNQAHYSVESYIDESCSSIPTDILNVF
ncbi:Peptidase C13, legumain [Cinara cedri]|uniref:legumain n=1 Tax=Cinara cedri TaxID=506608 RepID=A0A5E4MQS4_9HEMI|nr:Peptidase C13, legumain [Cinara cedri]